MNAPIAIEDVQGWADSRRIAIDKVGIKDILHPVRVRDRSQGEQHTVARFDMYVSLPHGFKGTHVPFRGDTHRLRTRNRCRVLRRHADQDDPATGSPVWL